MSSRTYQSRPLTLEDAQSFVDTCKAISAAIGTNRSYKAEFIRAQWQEPHFDLGTSSLGIFNGKEQLIAYVVIWDTNDTPVHPYIEWGVHPQYHHEEALSKRVLEWADKTSQRIIARCPADARLSLYSGAKKGYVPAENALERAGYVPIRHSYDMRIDMEQAPTIPELPDGFSVRTYHGNQDLVPFVRAFTNSFSDHFGWVEEPFEKYLEDFRHWFATDKLIDPELIFLCIDDTTDKIAGLVLGLREEHGDPSVGFIDLVGVLRSYRRRGLAQTLLYHAFYEFWKRNQKSVVLSVDADSLTNAVQLYEKVGMYIYHQYVRYEKLIREGQELAKVTVD